mmetsp:Transcript_29361/g.55450  ORF Transcript_29361/g.55450 Transcript_29361/m.55450 type:complete len:213 (+) Transcript_29361:1051-1689(+)
MELLALFLPRALPRRLRQQLVQTHEADLQLVRLQLDPELLQRRALLVAAASGAVGASHGGAGRSAHSLQIQRQAVGRGRIGTGAAVQVALEGVQVAEGARDRIAARRAGPWALLLDPGPGLKLSVLKVDSGSSSSVNGQGATGLGLGQGRFARFLGRGVTWRGKLLGIGLGLVSLLRRRLLWRRVTRGRELFDQVAAIIGHCRRCRRCHSRA